MDESPHLIHCRTHFRKPGLNCFVHGESMERYCCAVHEAVDKRMEDLRCPRFQTLPAKSWPGHH
jgi:hypothetical protein